MTTPNMEARIICVKPSFVFINLYILDEPFYDFFMRMVVIFNIFVQLLAQREILRVQLLLGFPSRMRIYPVLDALDLITGCQVYEFLYVCEVVILFPLVVLYIHGFALGIRAVNRALVHVHALQIVYDDGTHAFNEAVVLREFQIFHGNVERFHKIAEFNGILAFGIQKHLQIKLIVGGVIVIYHHVSLFTQLYELGLQRFVLLHQLFHDLHHVEFI